MCTYETIIGFENSFNDVQRRLGRGEFNPETTRVLHWVRNPEVEQQREDAAAHIAELELGNSALHSQLQQLESLHQQQQHPTQDGQASAGALGVEAAMADTEIAISKRKVCQQSAPGLQAVLTTLCSFLLCLAFHNLDQRIIICALVIYADCRSREKCQALEGGFQCSHHQLPGGLLLPVRLQYRDGRQGHLNSALCGCSHNIHIDSKCKTTPLT